MSNNINRIRKNKLKGTGIFAAAALTAALIAGNNIPGVTRQVSAAESQENTWQLWDHPVREKLL